MYTSEQIEDYIAGFDDWRGEILRELRATIHDADPEITEEWKWGVPVFTHGSMVCAISAFKNHVKMNFFKGSRLKDHHTLFNAGLDAKTMRSIDFHERDTIHKSKLKDLIREAVSYNTSS